MLNSQQIWPLNQSAQPASCIGVELFGAFNILVEYGNKEIEGEVANEGQGNIVGKQHDLIHFFDAVEQRTVNKKQECNYDECRYVHKEAGP